VSASAFISYSREDSEFALRLAQDMKAAGANVWLDQIDIKLGHPWDDAIEDALTEAPQMLVILSPASSKSSNVRDEIDFALRAGKIVVPILYVDCAIPLRLGRTQRIDFRADYAHGLTHLLDYLRVANPNPAVLQKAAEGDAQRQAAWQARDAEAQRLRTISEQPEPTENERAAEETRRQQELDAQVAEELSRKQAADLEAHERGERIVREAQQQADRILRDAEEQRRKEALERQEREEAERKAAEESRQKREADARAAEELYQKQAAERQAQDQAEQQAREANAARLREAQAQRTPPPPPPRAQPSPPPRFMPPPPPPRVLPTPSRNPAKIWIIVGAAVFGFILLIALIAYFASNSDTSGSSTNSTDTQSTTPSATPDSMYAEAHADDDRKDYTDAAPLYKSACDGGYLDACNNLGVLYEQGNGVSQDQQAALTVYQKACDGNQSTGCYNLARHYDAGMGVDPDAGQAKQIYQKACNLGDQDACTALKKAEFQ
jgi:TPR repeat protein